MNITSQQAQAARHNPPPPQTFGPLEAKAPPHLKNWHEPCSKRMCCPYHVTMARFWFFGAFHHHPGITTSFGKVFWRRHLLSIHFTLIIVVPVSLAEKKNGIGNSILYNALSPLARSISLSLSLYLRYTTTTTDYILILILHGSTCGGGHFFAEQGFASEGKVLGR